MTTMRQAFVFLVEAAIIFGLAVIASGLVWIALRGLLKSWDKERR